MFVFQTKFGSVTKQEIVSIGNSGLPAPHMACLVGKDFETYREEKHNWSITKNQDGSVRLSMVDEKGAKYSENIKLPAGVSLFLVYVPQTKNDEHLQPLPVLRADKGRFEFTTAGIIDKSQFLLLTPLKVRDGWVVEGFISTDAMGSEPLFSAELSVQKLLSKTYVTDFTKPAKK